MSPRLSIHLLQRDKSSHYGFDPFSVPYAGGMRNMLRSIARSEGGIFYLFDGLRTRRLVLLSLNREFPNLAATIKKPPPPAHGVPPAR